MAHADRTIIFDPEEHPGDTLKALDDFKTSFEFRYDAEFPDPPRVSMDAAIERWKVANTSTTITDPKPNLEQYDNIREQWRQKDMVAKFIGLFSSRRLIEDWYAAEPNEDLRKQASWKDFITKLRAYYKPTDNPVLVNFQFRSLNQQDGETFHGFCSRVEKESKTCYFKCDSDACYSDKIAVRDQVIIGTTNSKIRQEALLKSWNLEQLRHEGMQIEAAMRGESEISSSDGIGVNKIGKYSYKTLKGNAQKNQRPQHEESSRRQYHQSINQFPRKEHNNQTTRTPPKEKTCFNCGNPFSGNPVNHLQNMCKARNATCNTCGRLGHFSKFCKSKGVNQVKEDDSDEDVYSVNLFRIETAGTTSLERPKDYKEHDFKAEVVVNNSLASMIADTGAKVSVCGTKQADKWGLMGKMSPSKTKLKPYNSEAIPVSGVSRCAVTFGTRSTPVLWHIIKGSCEPILSGNAAIQLGIVKFNAQPETLLPIRFIDKHCQLNTKNHIQNLMTEYQDIFTTDKLGKMKDHQVILREDKSIKPVITPPRATHYHLQERVQEELERMIKNDVIEEHPRTEPAPWISAAHVTYKPDGGIRITMDARNVNKAILSNNLPIPKQEDIKAKMAGSNVLSKFDLRNAFWQFELAPESRYLTVFECNGKLYRYKRMTMGIKTSQGELNAALRPVLQEIPDAHHIHDDIVIASKSVNQHLKALEQFMKAIRKSGLTLNPTKCEFAKKEIKFWGMIVSSEGVRPDPEKVEVLEHLEEPKNKEELRSFLCMMQSNSDFIENFARISADLRELTRDRIHFRWEPKHQTAFTTLLTAFKANVALRYFDPNLPIFISTDAHKTGLAATLLQGKSRETAKPLSFSSRRTTPAESRYPQMDLEAMGVDFGLRRFRNYLLGAPEAITIITDHKPLLPVFNGNRSGSIRTEKIKARNQDINYNLVYKKGKLNETDYMSRHAKPFKLLSMGEKEEADEINSHLYTIHTTPITDRIGLKKIASNTAEDPILQQLKNIVESDRRWIPRDAHSDLLKFSPILDTITTTNSGILLKDDRIILPISLQEDAIQLAHQGSHTGQSGLQRRMRYHFFFHQMNEKIKNHIDLCFDCQLFTDKKCSEPLQHHKVPSKCWETVAVDLFGPLPSKKHIVVIQDLGSRFPVAKTVRSTSAAHVLPALGETYDLLGNPENQLSDNGPPFNSKAMQTFADRRSINLQKTPPLHPSSNPVETFMKPLGKAMKIGHKNKTPENQIISNLLENYRDTPHPSTGLPPNAMLFRDQPQTQFPRRKISDDAVQKARIQDKMIKETRTEQINESKYKQSSMVEVGDHVLMRNKRTSKFQPHFLPDDFTVTKVLNNSTAIEIKREDNGKVYIRHPDDVKRNIHHNPPLEESHQISSQEKLLEKWRTTVMSGRKVTEDDYSHDTAFNDQPAPTDEVPVAPQTPQGAAPVLVQEPIQGNVQRSPRVGGRGRLLTPQRLAQADAQESPATPRGRGRGRGRPRGQKEPPQLHSPPGIQIFQDDEMPDLTRAVRRSERNKKI